MVLQPQRPAHARRRDILSRTAAAIAASATVTFATPALAWCGGIFPGRISNDIEEGLVPYVEGSYTTDVFYRNVRPPKRPVMGSALAFSTQKMLKDRLTTKYT